MFVRPEHTKARDTDVKIGSNDGYFLDGVLF
jgi:hypothetical protein